MRGVAEACEAGGGVGSVWQRVAAAVVDADMRRILSRWPAARRRSGCNGSMVLETAKSPNNES